MSNIGITDSLIEEAREALDGIYRAGRSIYWKFNAAGEPSRIKVLPILKAKFGVCHTTSIRILARLNVPVMEMPKKLKRVKIPKVEPLVKIKKGPGPAPKSPEEKNQ